MSGPIFPGPRRWRGPDYRIRITPGNPKPVARVAGSRYRPLIRFGLVASVLVVLAATASSPPGLALILSMVLFGACAVLALIDEVRQP
jgi:hypothetical protein